MKIAFYAPCNEHNQQAGPLLGIGYMASYLQEQHGLEDIYLEVDAQRAMAQKPDLLAISAFSEKYNQVQRDVRAIRREHPELPIILGGPHISAMPQSLFQDINLGVIGEGEKPMSSLVQAYLDDGELRPERLRDIKNLVFWNENQSLERTLFEDRIRDLDALPLPRREIMKAWWPFTDQDVVFDRGVYTSRGCSFRCHFCMYSERANLIRYVSIDKVMEDIMDILRHYPEQKHIIFYDDLFVTKKSRLKKLADAIRSEGIHKRVSFGCMAKTSFFDAEYAQILRDMNMRVISWGFESGADEVLQYLKDRHSTVRKHQQSIDISRQYGIMAGGYFIIGAPPESKTQLAQTYWFIRKNLASMPVFGVFPIIPLPGTALWNETAARGLVDDSYDRWDDLEFLDIDERYLHLNTHYSKAELLEAFERDFGEVAKWNGIFPQLQKRWVNQRPYLNQAAEQMLQEIRPGQRVVEIQAGVRELGFALEEAQLESFQSLYWQDRQGIEALEPGAVDAVVLTHSLEKIGLQSWQWRKLKSLNCPIFMLVEQVGFLPHLLDLLTGRFPDWIEKTDMYEVNYRYTLQSLHNALAAEGYAIQHLERYEMPVPSESFKHLKAQLDALTALMPMQDFLKEAGVFAYGLRVEPCASDSST